MLVCLTCKTTPVNNGLRICNKCEESLMIQHFRLHGLNSPPHVLLLALQRGYVPKELIEAALDVIQNNRSLLASIDQQQSVGSKSIQTCTL
jgi:hypothetical protein